MRYLITTPGTKGTALRELGKRVLGKNAVVDDLAKLTSKKADNIVSKIITLLQKGFVWIKKIFGK